MKYNLSNDPLAPIYLPDSGELETNPVEHHRHQDSALDDRAILHTYRST